MDGKDVIEALIARMEDQNAKVREAAVLVVIHTHTTAKGVATAIAARLKDEDREVCRRAITALHRVRPDTKLLVPLLVEAVNEAKNERGDFRQQALVLLSRLGPNAKDAVRALIEIIKDQGDGQRRDGLIALRAIGPPAEPAVPVLVGIAKDVLDAERSLTVAVFGGIAPRPPCRCLSRSLVTCNMELENRPSTHLDRLVPPPSRPWQT